APSEFRYESIPDKEVTFIRLTAALKTPLNDFFVSSTLQHALAEIVIVGTQKIAAGAIKRLRRAEILVIILVQFAPVVQPNLVQHARVIHHAAHHFFGTLWIGSHRQMNRIIPWRGNIDQITGREPLGKSSCHPDALNEPKTAE